jgi:hypothetical protein
MKPLVICLVLLGAAALSGTASLGAQELSATIRECSGDVEIKVPGGEWVPAGPGMRLQSSALISTGFKSSALLVLGNSTLQVRPVTCLSLEELVSREGGERIGLALRTGRIRAVVTPPPDVKVSFTVRSPVATASVRGTSFEFDAFNLRVLSGTVAFTGGDNVTVFAGADQKTAVDPQGRSSAPVGGEEQEPAQIGPPASPGPVVPVAAGPGGTLIIPGAVSPPPETGGAEIDTRWRQ